MKHLVIAFFLIYISAFSSYSQFTDEYYLNISKQHQKILLKEVCSYSGWETSKENGIYNWSVLNSNINSETKKVRCEFSYARYSSNVVEKFEIVFIEGIPVIYNSGLGAYCNRYGSIIYSDENITKIMVGLGAPLSYDSYINYFGDPLKKLNIDKKRYNKIVGLYNKYKESEFINSPSYIELMGNYKEYDLKYSPKNCIAVFSKTKRVNEWTWQKNPEYEKGTSVLKYTLQEGDNEIDITDYFYKNISTKPIVIKGVFIKSDAYNTVFEDRSIYLMPNDIISYMTIHKNFDTQNFEFNRTIYFWGEVGEIKKMQAPLNITQNYKYHDAILAKKLLSQDSPSSGKIKSNNY